MNKEPIKIVKFLPTKVWIEDNVMGDKHVMRQHDGREPFCYCSFYYSYEHTSNSTIHDEAVAMAKRLGATEPVGFKQRNFPMQTNEEMIAQYEAEISELQDLVKNMKSRWMK